jgi:PAS domain S-box-containing protein
VYGKNVAMAINPIALISLFVAFSVAILGAYVYSQDPKNPLNKSYIRLSLVLFGWNFFQFVYRSVQSYQIAYVWLKVAVLFGAFVSPTLLHFSLQFSLKKVLKRWWVFIIIYLPSIVIGYFWVATDLLINGPIKVGGWYDTYATGSDLRLLVISMLWLLSMATIAIILIFIVWIRKPKTRAQVTKRQHAKFISIGFGVMLALTLTTELILRAIGAQPIFIGTWAAGLVVILIGYAISRYELFVINPATTAEQIISTMTDSLVITDPAGQILIANKATFDMLGYKKEELIGKNIKMLFKEADFDHELKEISPVKKPVINHAIDYLTKNRKTVPILLSCSVIYSKRGELAGNICVAKNISDRKRAEEAIREAQIKQVFVDVFYAVTGKKLILLTQKEIHEALGKPVSNEMHLSNYKDLAETRRTTRDTANKEFPEIEDLMDIQVAIGEALTNAIKHAGEASYQIFKNNKIAQFFISDKGPGIDFKTLPKATLLSGYSTKKTLGVGFSIMLEFSDRVLISTQPGGTSLVLEINLEPDTEISELT